MKIPIVPVPKLLTLPRGTFKNANVDRDIIDGNHYITVELSCGYKQIFWINHSNRELIRRCYLMKLEGIKSRI